MDRIRVLTKSDGLYINVSDLTDTLRWLARESRETNPCEARGLEAFADTFPGILLASVMANVVHQGRGN